MRRLLVVSSVAAASAVVAAPDLVVEVVDAPGETAVARAVVAALGGTYGVTVASFDWYGIAAARDAGLRTAFRTPRGIAAGAALAYAADAGHAEVHPHWTAALAEPDAVARARELGVAVACGPVADPAAAQALRAAGVEVLDHHG